MDKLFEENKNLNEACMFIEEKHGSNVWNCYPPSKMTVTNWLIEYSNQSKKELLEVLEKINSFELESTYPGFNKETRILEIIEKHKKD